MTYLWNEIKTFLFPLEFVQEYGDELIEIIIETELNPEQICGALTLCDMSSIWGKWNQIIYNQYGLNQSTVSWGSFW